MFRSLVLLKMVLSCFNMVTALKCIVDNNEAFEDHVEGCDEYHLTTKHYDHPPAHIIIYYIKHNPSVEYN